jgi:hypothetical protein
MTLGSGPIGSRPIGATAIPGPENELTPRNLRDISSRWRNGVDAAFAEELARRVAEGVQIASRLVANIDDEGDVARALLQMLPRDVGLAISELTVRPQLAAELAGGLASALESDVDGLRALAVNLATDQDFAAVRDLAAHLSRALVTHVAGDATPTSIAEQLTARTFGLPRTSRAHTWDWASSIMFGLAVLASRTSRGDAAHQSTAVEPVGMTDTISVELTSAPELRLAERVQLEPKSFPEPADVAELSARLEPLLTIAFRLLHDGVFDDDPVLRDRVERDAQYLNDESFGTDHDGEWLGPLLGSMIARLERSVLAKTAVPDRERVLLDALVAATSSLDPTEVVEAVDMLADHVSESAWLAVQEQFDSFVASPGEPARETIGSALGWLAGNGDSRSALADGAQLESVVGGVISAAVAAVMNPSLQAAAAGTGALLGAIVGIALAWFACSWKRRVDAWAIPHEDPDF